MAALPENWEWDYDGTRWFYRYKPTGLIQYTFPKPGDEFPEFVDDNAAPLDLAPEERLVSQQQIKRRSTLGGSSRGQPARAKQRERAASNVSSDQDDGGEPFWLQPDGLMYMGPGAYNDISPLQEEDEDERGQATNDADDGGDKKDSASATTQHVADGPAAAGSPSKGAAVAVPSQISPSTSTETTPQVPNSQPATATPQGDRAIIVESVDAAPAPVVAAPVDPPAPEIPLLDSREVPYDPLGFVAELPSELTAQCHVEINPAPVELPGNELMVDTSEPAPYANAFHLQPAELPSDEIPAGRRVARNTAEQKSLSSQTTRSQQEQQQQRPHQTTRELLSRPYGAARQNSTPQVASTVAHMPGGGVAEPPPSGKYQPYNPARQGAFGAAAANRHSIAEIRPLVPADDNNKRHSLAGPALSRVPPSDVPAALLPPHIPPKLPLDSPDSSRQSSLPGAEARHESISGLTTKASGGLTHFPSVLQPARGRPVMRAQSPPQSKGASPARAYQAYKPYHDLQRDIEDTVQLLSNAGFGQGTTTSAQASSVAARPQASRTNTLPAHLPSLPYMGGYPHLPPSSASVPAPLTHLHSHQTPPAECGGCVATGGAAGSVMPLQYSAPLPPSSPDLPPPLNISRKSPPLPSSVPTGFSAFRPEVTAKADAIFSGATAAPVHTTAASAPAPASLGAEANPDRETMLAAPNSAGPAGQAGAASYPNQAGSSGPPPSAAAKVEGTASFNSLAASSEKLQPSGHPSPAKPASFAVEAVGAAPVMPLPSEAAPVSDSGSSPAPLPADVLVTVTDQQPLAPSASDVGYQETRQSIPAQSDLVGPDNVHIPPHVVSEVHHKPPANPNMPLPTDGTVQSASAVLYASPAPAATVASQVPFNSHTGGRGANPEMTPPRSVASPRAPTPSPRTPSPLSRASSPPTQQNNIQKRIPSVSPPAIAMAGSAQQGSFTGQQTLLHKTGIHAPVVGLGPAPMPSSSSALPNASLAAPSTGPGHTFQTDHNSLGSYQVGVSQLSAPGAVSAAEHGYLPTHESGDCQRPAAQVHADNIEAAAAPNQQSQQPPQGVVAPVVSQSAMPNANPGLSTPLPAPAPTQEEAPSSPVSVADQEHKRTQPPMPSPMQAIGQTQLPLHSGGQLPSNVAAHGQPSVAPTGRPFSPPATTQLGPLPHPGAPGTAPPQPPVMLASPTIPAGMVPQGVHPGMFLQQQYAYHPSVFPQPGMQVAQHQPVPPHLLQPGQMPMGAPLTQAPQPPQQPVKQEKSWFGRLWRSESVKKPTKSGAAAQPGTPPQQLFPVFPPSVPPNQPAPPHQFALAAVQPHMAMMTMNNQNYPSQPQFRAPNHNPNQPVMPPPQVRPAIQQQAQLLHHPAQRPSSIGPGQGQTAQQEQSPVQPPAPAQAQGQTQPQGGTPVPVALPVQGQGQGQGQEQATGERHEGGGGYPVAGENGSGGRTYDDSSKPAVSAAPVVTPAANASAAGRWGNAGPSEYDGSGWGDDDDE